MKRLLIILFILPLVVKAQFPTKYKFLPTPVIDTPGDYEPKPSPPPVGIDTFTFSFTALAGDYIRPGAGIEYWYETPWNDFNAVKVPSGNATSYDSYWRFKWRDFETTTQGVYDWTRFDQKMNAAIDNGWKLNFSVMTLDGSVWEAPTVGGAYLTYPDYLHTQMQGAPTNEQDWIGAGLWIPNWNSEFYLSAFEDLNIAINNHLNTTSYNGHLYKDVVGYIDLRGYGNFGEWHNYPYSGDQPTGRVATIATLKRIIDAHTDAFPNHPLIALSDGFANWGSAATPDEVVLYLLNASNTWGPVGWRRDNWGNPEYDDRLVNNPVSFGGEDADTIIMNRWKTSPIVGEPWRGNSEISNGGTQCPFYDLQSQVEEYHAMSFGNGNYQNLDQACMRTNVRNASAACGYQLSFTAGMAIVGTDFKIKLSWQNTGIAPTYEHWDVVYELRNGAGSVVWRDTSSFDPFRFYNTTDITDTYTTPAISGTFDLYIKIVDPESYRLPLPLKITGRDAGGAYYLKTIVL